MLVLFLSGHLLLSLFGITIPVIQLAGGIMICKTGRESLTDDKTTTSDSSNTDNENLDEVK